MAPSDRVPLRLLRERPDVVPAVHSDSEDLLVTFGFRCNLRCAFCMVEDALGVYQGADLETMSRFLADAEAMARVRRVTLSGGEATLERDLPAYARRARATPGVEHVRVQTNGTRLAEPGYLDALVDAGVDEVFVSLHAATAATCDRITGRAGSFADIVAGIEAAAAHPGVALHTNSVISAPAFRELPALVDLLCDRGAVGVELWNLWPRVDPADERGLFARVGEAAPFVVEALSRCAARPVPAVVKWFPRCLLGEHADAHDDSQPTVLVEQRFWDAAPSFACLFAASCAHAQDGCGGLSTAYVRAHGWEEDVLSPRALGATGDAAAWTELAPFGVRPGVRLGPWAARAARRRGDRLEVEIERGRDRARLFLFASSPERPCAVRTERWDVSYSTVEPPLRSAVVEAARALGERLRRIEGP